jgi:deoxyribonuclease-4
MSIRFGVHCSLRDGLEGALLEAQQKKCEAMQIFTRSPRMWKMSRHSEQEVAGFRELRKKLNIYPLAVHIPYLPNIATSNSELYLKSVNALIEDLEVANQIGADFLVIHPGAWSEGSTIAEGIIKVVEALNTAISKVEGNCLVLLETVAGGGRRVGSRFEEIALMLKGVNAKERSGVCLDTAHSFAAGYDISKPAATDKMLADFDRIIGLDKLKMLHFNDSMVPCGARKDRHQHLGKGFIGALGFKYLVSKVKNIAQAGILETPKEPEGSDDQNLSLLFKWRK